MILYWLDDPVFPKVKNERLIRILREDKWQLLG